MSAKDWHKIEPLLNEALNLPPEQRAAFLQQTCGDEESLRQEVEALLAEEERLNSFLETPVLPLPDDLKAAAAPTPSLIGQQLGKYKIVSLLGKGGMGEVYLAHDPELDRQVAIKLLPPGIAHDSEQIARFKREARMLAKLKNHPNIAIIHDLELNAATPFLVLEYVPGETLAERMQAGRLPLAEALPLFQQIAAALVEAQQQGIIHRDLKPANIKIAPGERVKVLDFGLAKILHHDAATTELANTAQQQLQTTRSYWTTARHVISGTVPYMSPEQTYGLPLDHRTDLWAFGCLCFEALTGRRPFQGTDTIDLFHAIRTQEPDWQLLPANTPDAIRNLLQRCLHKEPEARLAAAADALELLTNVATQTQPSKIVIQLKRWKTPLAAGTITMLLLGLGVTFRQPIRSQVSGLFAPQTLPLVISQEKTLVILPFKELGDSPEGTNVGRGLAKALQDLLASVGELRVLPVAEAVQANVANASPDKLAQTLGVNLLLTGEVQRAGEAVTIRYQVQNRQGAVIYRDEASGQNNEYAKLQAAIVAKVTQVLNVAPPQLPTAATFQQRASEEKYLAAIGALQSDLTKEALVPIIAELHALHRTEPKSPHLLAALADAYFQKAAHTNDPADVTTALDFTEKALPAGEQIVEVAIVRGQSLLWLEKYDEAIECFVRARDRQPSNFLLLIELATTYQQKAANSGTALSAPQREQLLQKAQETLQAAVLFWPLYWSSHNELGAFYFDQGQYEQARKEWEQTVELHPTSPVGQINLGNVYIKQGKNVEAEKAFRQVLDQLTTKQQTKEEAYLGWGTAVYYQGRFPEAAQIFTLGSEQHPKSYLLQINLGDALRQMNDKGVEAQTAYQKAAELLQNTQRGAIGLAHLAEVYAKRSRLQTGGEAQLANDKQQAQHLMRRALAKAPQEADVLASATLVYHLTGDTDRAMVYCQQAVAQGYRLDDFDHEPDLRELRLDSRYTDLKQQSRRAS